MIKPCDPEYCNLNQVSLGDACCFRGLRVEARVAAQQLQEDLAVLVVEYIV